MIHAERFVLKKYKREHYEHAECDHFLDHLELHKGKRATIFFKTYTIGRHLRMYSNRAMPQLMRITATRLRFWLQVISLNFRWPYHAKVIKVLEAMRRRMVRKGFISKTQAPSPAPGT